MPLGAHSPLTPAGQVEQLEKISLGLGRLTGWRKVAVRIVLALVVLLAVVLLVANAARIFG